MQGTGGTSLREQAETMVARMARGTQRVTALTLLVACVCSLSLVSGFAPSCRAPVLSLGTPGAGTLRAACALTRARQLAHTARTASRRTTPLKMVDIQPRVDIVEEDFAPPAFTRQGSGESEMYAADDGGTEWSDKDASEEASSDEERDPGDLRNFEISEQTLDNLAQHGISKLFPVQIATFNEIFAGRDVLARARTGTGKTLGFALPIVERLIADKIASGNLRRSRGTKPACVILSPTRELAVQIEREVEWLTDAGDVRVSSLCVYGGVPYSKQERELRNGVDMVIGTPGRMIDLYEKGMLDLTEAKYLVSPLHCMTNVEVSLL